MVFPSIIQFSACNTIQLKEAMNPDRPSQRTILPPALQPGDAIGIAAPASAFDANLFQRGIMALESLGFRAIIPENLSLQRGYLAGTDAHRAAIINRLFSDRDVKAIMCARGGFGSLKILSMLDYDLIRTRPKIFAGFSDITVLLSVFFEKTGLVTLHAPVITTLADAGEATRTALAAAFMSPEPTTLAAVEGIPLVPGRATGIVRGGNLASLCQLTGTPYQPDLKGSLLLLEDTAEAPYRIDRMLTQMRLAGCLDGVAGVILGRFDQCGEMREIYDIVRACFTESIPILAGLPVGHEGDNLPLPLGLSATLDADRGTLAYDSPALSTAVRKAP